LNSPSTTLILCLRGSSGESDLLSFMSAPSPVELQWSSLMPHPMNMTPKRWGKGAAAVAAVAPKTRTDSSHGSAMTTPAPRNTARRETVRANVRGTRFCGKSFSDM
jgi:hypothetical protein